MQLEMSTLETWIRNVQIGNVRIGNIQIENKIRLEMSKVILEIGLLLYFPYLQATLSETLSSLTFAKYSETSEERTLWGRAICPL